MHFNSVIPEENEDLPLFTSLEDIWERQLQHIAQEEAERPFLQWMDEFYSKPTPQSYTTMGIMEFLRRIV